MVLSNRRRPLGTRRRTGRSSMAAGIGIGHGLAMAVSALCLILAGPEPASADNGVGKWSVLGDWPFIPIHAILMANGSLLTYGSNTAGRATGRFSYDIWDWRDGIRGAHVTLPNTTVTDIFCSAQILLPGSEAVFIAGGDNWDGSKVTNVGNNDTNVLDPATNRLTPGRDMFRPRWYATMTTLPNGEIYIQGGKGGADRAEVRQVDGTHRLLAAMDTSRIDYYYPRNWVAPNGKVFGYTKFQMYEVDPAGAGRLTNLASLPADGPAGIGSSEVMFAPGRILRMGGSVQPANVAVNPARDAAVVIDINGARPVVTRAASMPARLDWHNATVIPDGRVVVTGGSGMRNLMTGANYRALIWDPASGSWSVGAATGSGKARLYHSTAVLLPDGSVFVGGGGAYGPQTNRNAEIYYPPNLLSPNGAFAPRPRIVRAPERLRHGIEADVTVDNAAAIGRVTLIKTGSVTHSFNMEQRFIELGYRVVGNTLKIRPPASRNLATPGVYLLFVLNRSGVPSIAAFVSM